MILILLNNILILRFLIKLKTAVYICGIIKPNPIYVYELPACILGRQLKNAHYILHINDSFTKVYGVRSQLLICSFPLTNIMVRLFMGLMLKRIKLFYKRSLYRPIVYSCILCTPILSKCFGKSNKIRIINIHPIVFVV